MESRGGKSQRREEKKEDQKRESLRRKKIQVRIKVGKSRETVSFQWFEAPEGRKVGSRRRRVRSQLARLEMKNCAPLWREAHFQVKMYKAHQVRTTFGSCDVEKVHAVVGRSTFQSQNVESTPAPDHFWKLRCWKSARRCGAKHISKSKVQQGGPENPKAKRRRANHFFLHAGNSTVSSSLRRNLDVFPVAVDQSLHWSSCASVDRLIPSKHPLVDHFMHMAPFNLQSNWKRLVRVSHMTKLQRFWANCALHEQWCEHWWFLVSFQRPAETATKTNNTETYLQIKQN